MEALAVTMAEQHVAASPAKGHRAGRAAAAGKVESQEGAGPGGRVLAPEGTAMVVEAAENPEAERVPEALARAAERIAVAEVAKVLQSAVAELKEKRRSTWLKPRNATQQEEEDQGMGKVSPSRLIMMKCRIEEVQKKFEKWGRTS